MHGRRMCAAEWMLFIILKWDIYHFGVYQDFKHHTDKIWFWVYKKVRINSKKTHLKYTIFI